MSQEHSAAIIVARRIPINWHPGLSIYASEPFLRAVGDEYGWLGGYDGSDNLCCILPYTTVHKAFFRLVRFRVETIPVGAGLSIEEEKSFLNNVVDYFHSIGADMIIPGTTNAVFRTYPDGAIAAPYGSYVIDLTQPEETIWNNVNSYYRKSIRKAIRNGVTIHTGMENIEAVYVLIVDTFKRSKLPFMKYSDFKRYLSGLGDNGKIMIADHNGVAQSYVVFGYSQYCAYAIYAGNVTNQQQGANKLLYWEAIRSFKESGVLRYDFVGARINPEKGSKQEGINTLKERFGAMLVKGYMWKYPLKPIKYGFYRIASYLRTGGDIVDVEHHKLKTI